MSHSYRIELENRIVHLNWEAEITFEDWEVLLSAVLEDPAFKTGFNFLSDRRSSDSEPPAPDYAQQVAEFFEGHSDQLGKCKWAAIADNSNTYALACMLSIIATAASVEVQVFHDPEIAREWLLH